MTENSFRSFENIDVKLVGAISSPFELSVASARTCYSPKGVILPEEVSLTENSKKIRDKIAESTLEAGHLTTRQHAHFVFAISGVTRQFIWAFLHSHPFYNSEQVSQRYVRVKKDSFLVPPLSERERKLYENVASTQMDAYEALIEVLRPTIRKEYYEIFPSRKKYEKIWDKAVEKRVYEVARYVLGIGTTAYLYHTVSALTLLRYYRMMSFFETPTEQKYVISQMIRKVLDFDPLFEKELQAPYEVSETFSPQWKNQSTFANEFDKKLEGKTSKLISYTQNATEILADSLRSILSKSSQELSNNEAIDILLSPEKNKMLGDSINLTYQDRISQCLHHAHFVFQKKISHTADSQDQRHRMTFRSQPNLILHYDGKPDYIIPYAISINSVALEMFDEMMDKTFSSVNELLDSGVSSEFAFYLLPNALSIRMFSSGDLVALHHKFKMRSCYNAQEEIFKSTIEEILQIQEVFPEIGKYFRAPCWLRKMAKVTPYCPEGDRYCGRPVWNYNLNQYQRKSI